MAYLHRRLAVMLLLTALSAVLAACGRLTAAASVPVSPGSGPVGVASPGSRNAGLAQLAGQALSIARVAAKDALLRQIDIVWNSQEHIFRFTSAALSTGMRANGEIDVVMPRPGTPPTQWSVVPPSMSPLVTSARIAGALDLAALKITPEVAIQALLRQWPKATPKVATLASQGAMGTTLIWYASGSLGGGDVSLTIRNATGKVNVPLPNPVQPPSIATRQP